MEQPKNPRKLTDQVKRADLPGRIGLRKIWTVDPNGVEDRTPFEAIEWQFGLKENDVRALMRRSLKRTSFEMWRKRVRHGDQTLEQASRRCGAFPSPGQRP